MPNTLAHIGVQGLATQILIRDADPKWIYVGCIIPDLPWILQRFIRVAFSGIDLYDVRLYAVVQSSLFFSLILSVALAALSTHLWRVFSILALNSLLHLLFDPFQLKWANGVHLFAPISWEMTNFGFFWPESLPTYLLTGLGLIYFLWNWRRGITIPVDINLRSATRLFIPTTLIIIYFVVPFFLLDGPERADNHFVRTLQNTDDRAGKYIEIDRDSYSHSPSGDSLQTFAGEELEVEGMALEHSATVSVRGTFVTDDKIHVHEYHVHYAFRDIASYVGLTLIAIIWIVALLRQKFGKRLPPPITFRSNE
ncbi:MAG TPA: hypothetical protein VHT73_08795 [Thermodesulfobacteriota bacterium]|nr:hypothetical protein [Thermodesulfobacteriota bacterium]